MIKGLFKLVVIIAVVCAVAYFGANLLLDAFSQKALDYIVNNIKVPNLELTRPTFQGVGMSSFNAVTWRGVAIYATIVRNEVSGQAVNATINIDALTLKVANISEGIVILDLKGLSASLQGLHTARGESAAETAASEGEAGDRMENGNLAIRLRLSLSNPRAVVEQLRELSSEMKKFSEDGVTAIPITFSALQTFTIKGNSYSLRIWVEPEEYQYRLLADPNDVETISSGVAPYWGAGHGVEAGDIQLIARNPIRAPMLLRIREKIASTARLEQQNDPSFPESAFRHVYWGYLLAKQYGSEFADEVGKAHHVGTADEADTQDFTNMATGRRYAILGYDESSIKERVLTDPEVIRTH